MKKETTKKSVKEQVKNSVFTQIPEDTAAQTIEVMKKEKTIEKIAEDFKKEHKDVFLSEIAGLQIIWRKLKRKEYKELMLEKFDDNEELAYLERQDFIAKKVILYPENVEEIIEEYAGIADLIATNAMVKAGFGIANTKTV